MAGLDFALLAAFLWIVDGLGYKRAIKPLVVMGLNPITIYMISELLDEPLYISGLHGTLYHTLLDED